MTGAQATGLEAPAAVVKEVERALADMGITAEQFDLRYGFVQGQTQ
jgi:hypothetical protein